MKKKFIAVALVLAMSVICHWPAAGKKSDKKSSDSDMLHEYTSMTAEELQDTVLKDVED